MIQMDTIENLKKILSVENISETEFVDNIGKFVDCCAEQNLVFELDFAIELFKKLKNRINLQYNKCLYHYFFSVAYGEKHRIEIANSDKDWIWEQEIIENELQNLRLAYELIDNEIPIVVKSYILTNLANRFNNLGRFLCSFEFWNKAIETETTTGMPLVNKGNSLMQYGLNFINEPKYQYAYIQLGYQYFKFGLKKDIYPNVENDVLQRIKNIESQYRQIIDFQFDRADFENIEITNKEYLNWIIEKELFLNPLSNVDIRLQCSRDDLKINSQIDNKLISLFDSIIDKYKYSRLQFFESSIEKDTVISKQQKQSAFSAAYSIFDKIAYFINSAFNIEIKNDRVAFKRLWYNKSQKENGINQKFIDSKNLMLRAIFWISKDIYINEKGFKNLIEPKAKEIDTIRNYIEHKDFQFGTKSQDDFTFTIPIDEFDENYLRLLKLVRESIIYLAYSIK